MCVHRINGQLCSAILEAFHLEWIVNNFCTLSSVPWSAHALSPLLHHVLVDIFVYIARTLFKTNFTCTHTSFIHCVCCMESVCSSCCIVSVICEMSRGKK